MSEGDSWGRSELTPWYLRYSFCRMLGTRVLLFGEVHTLSVTYTR